MEQSPGVWERPRRGRRGPAPEHDLDRIAAAALALADADGLAAVTMRAVAAALGTGPASLYRYVRTRDELVELMADAAYGEIDGEAAPAGDWLAGLLALARESRRMLLRHPWLLEVAETPRPLGPNAADYLDRALGVLESAETDTRTKFEAIGVLNALVVMLVRAETAGADRDAAGPAALARLAAEGRRPHLAAALADPAPAPPEGPGEAFDRVVSRVLTGLV
ncbi:TetR/AcrR family transcriptional regulator [Glycomyces sp. A-F 0318]|uniref:TetR/AcrR family transcriptional regulator C-terminal domain-containing protein n=1 Tax=Glycomyces amatae TaxID=2881355 RepID=UPI001E4FA45C|nr:TetR/AcrR family transcriptional regulator [Glycomyces amatae]